MPFEYGGQTWPDTPFVLRQGKVTLMHPTPDDVVFYECQWTDGTDITSFRVGLARVKKIEEGRLEGPLWMHLVPGQPGEIRCKAGAYKDQEAADIAFNITAYREWAANHPGEKLNLEVAWSDWSNPLPLGVVEPNPVPEPGVLLLLLAGLLGLVVMGWRRKTR